MVKNSIPIAPDLQPDRRRSKVLPIASIIILAPLLAPLALETISICHGQWCEILGTRVEVRTPTLDAIGDRVESVRQDVWSRVSGSFERVPWNPMVALPVIVVVMVIALMILRL